MNRRIVLGTLSGLAAILLAVGGTTLAADSETSQVSGNHLSAGFLRVQLDADGTGAATLDLGASMPGQTRTQLIWVSSAAGGGVARAALALNLHQLQDLAAPCGTSIDKARAEIAAGISGCTVTGNTATGRPAQGNLSRVLAVAIGYYPSVADPGDCAGTVPSGTASTILAANAGDLHADASGAGTTLPLDAADGTPVMIASGAGVCLAVRSSWPSGNTAPAHPSAAHPADNAAQGDSLVLALTFDLTQAP